MSQFNSPTPPKTGDRSGKSETDNLEIKPNQNKAANTDNDRAYGPGGGKVKDTTTENSDRPTSGGGQVAEPGYEQQRADPIGQDNVGGSDSSAISPDNTLL